MSGDSVLWAEAPDEDRETPDAEAHGDVDESFAARRLRRWIKGMFGGAPRPGDEDERPRSGPAAGDPGEPGGSPAGD